MECMKGGKKEVSGGLAGPHTSASHVLRATMYLLTVHKYSTVADMCARATLIYQ